VLKFTFYIKKFSIFIWKTWKSQGIFKFILNDNPERHFKDQELIYNKMQIKNMNIQKYV